MKTLVRAFLFLLVSVNVFAVDSFWTSAANGDMVGVKRYVEKLKIDVNTPDEKGFSALTYATYFGKTEVVRYLIGNGANINFLDSKGGTPICYAIDNENIDVFRLLLSDPKIDLNVKIDDLFFSKNNLVLAQTLAQLSGIEQVTSVETLSKDGAQYAQNIIEYAIASTEIQITAQQKLSTVAALFGRSSSNNDFLAGLRTRSWIISQLLAFNSEVAKIPLHLKEPDYYYFAILYHHTDAIKKAMQKGWSPTDLELSIMFISDNFELLDFMFDTETINSSDISKYVFEKSRYSIALLQYLQSKNINVDAIQKGSSTLVDLVLASISTEDVSRSESKAPISKDLVEKMNKSALLSGRPELSSFLVEKYGLSSVAKYSDAEIATLLKKNDPNILNYIISNKISLDTNVGGKSILKYMLDTKNGTFLKSYFSGVSELKRPAQDVAELNSIIKLNDIELFKSYMITVSNSSDLKATAVSSSTSPFRIAIQLNSEQPTILSYVKTLQSSGFVFSKDDVNLATRLGLTDVASFMGDQLLTKNIVVQPSDPQIYGAWRDDGKREDFWGYKIIYYEFFKDGTYKKSYKIMKDGTIDSNQQGEGKYEANAGVGRLFTSDNKVVNFKYEITKDILSLQEAEQVSPLLGYRYSPQSQKSSANAKKAAPIIDKTLVGNWGTITPKQAKAQGMSDKAITLVINDDGTLVYGGMISFKWQASSGAGKTWDLTMSETVMDKKEYPFTYSIKDGVLTFDSTDIHFGGKRTLYFFPKN